MKQMIFFIILIVVVCCKQTDTHLKTHSTKLFSNELLTVISKYQNEIKIPPLNKTELRPSVKSVKSSLIYVYEAYFFIDKKDTILELSLKSSGIRTFTNKKDSISDDILGIYSNESLDPIYIYDRFRVSKPFLLTKIRNLNVLNSYIIKENFVNDDNFKIHRYKLQKGKYLLDN